MKTTKILFWIATGLLSLLLLMSAGMYIFDHKTVSEMFVNFGYPTYIIYPLAFAKLSAVVVLVLQNKSKTLSSLKEWAYSALFFEFLLAIFAHVMINDGGQIAAIMAMILLLTSYITLQKTKTK